MAELTLQEAEKIWLKAERVKNLSDRIINLGPFSIGLDGIIALMNNPITIPLIPAGIAADQVYTWVAGIYLLTLGNQAKASGGTLLRMFAYIVVDAVLGAIPGFGVVDYLFKGHKYAARALQKDIERRYPH